MADQNVGGFDPNGSNVSVHCSTPRLNIQAQLAEMISAVCSVTGPIKPDSSNRESFAQWCHVVKVSRPLGLGFPSSSHRGHPLSSLPFHSQSGGNCSSPIS